MASDFGVANRLVFFRYFFYFFLIFFEKVDQEKKYFLKIFVSEIFTKLCRNAWRSVSSHHNFVLTEIYILSLTKHEVSIFRHFSLFFFFADFQVTKVEGLQLGTNQKSHFFQIYFLFFLNFFPKCQVRKIIFPEDFFFRNFQQIM